MGAAAHGHGFFANSHGPPVRLVVKKGFSFHIAPSLPPTITGAVAIGKAVAIADGAFAGFAQCPRVFC